MVQQQALVQRRDADRQACLAGEEGRPAVDFLGAQLQSGQQLQQDFPASGRFGAEQYAAGELLDEPAQRGQRLGGLGFDRQVRQRQGREALAPDARLDVLLAGDHPWPVLQPGEAVFHRKEHFRRRQQWPFRIDPAVLVAAAYVIPELLRGLFDAGQGEHLGVLRQVVEEGRGFLEEQRQVVLDSRGCQTAGEVLVDRAAPVVDVEALAEAAAEAGDRFLVQGNSRAGSRRIDSTLSMERWVSGSKVRRVSISSSNRSIRKGNSLPIGNRSISAPRTANSPCS